MGQPDVSSNIGVREGQPDAPMDSEEGRKQLDDYFTSKSLKGIGREIRDKMGDPGPIKNWLHQNQNNPYVLMAGAIMRKQQAATQSDYATGAPYAKGADEVTSAIEVAAKRYDLNPTTLKAIASIESDMNPGSNANKPTTQYKGLFQMGKEEWAKYGEGGNIYNAKDNAYAAARMLADRRDDFKDKYGKDPTDAQLYMLHQQGPGFYSKGAMSNITGNPYPGMSGPQTHKSFEAGWAKELDKRMDAFK